MAPTSWQAHGIVKRQRSNRRFQRASPPGQSSASGGDPGLFFWEKKADIFSMKCLSNLRSIVYQVMQWTIYYINFTPLASPGVTTAVSSVPTGGEDSDFEIEYVEEEVEEELPTDDDSVAVLQHDQRQEPDTASREKNHGIPGTSQS